MANTLDTLIGQIADQALRAELAREVGKLKAQKKFGLVFEEHLPEVVLLPSLPVKTGGRVVKRDGPANDFFTVLAPVNGAKVRIVRERDGKEEIAAAGNLVPVKKFGEPIYPALVPVASVVRDPAKPHHILINADNFHALQLLLYTHEDQVDVIYIDPPYNTGARDWKYNNDYVDDADPWRHSKWLSFLERRLRLAQRLLKRNGVIVVTIDEHEVHHLGCLLAQMFPNARRQMVTIVNNAAGVTQGGFYRVEEHAFFCFLGDAKPVPSSDDLLSDENSTETTSLWFSLIRYGGINALPSKRGGLVYPIAIDPKRNKIVAAGETLKQLVAAGDVKGNLNAWKPAPNQKLHGFPVVWPFRGNGSLSTWQLSPKTLFKLAKEGLVRVRPQADGPGGNEFSITYVKSGNQKKIKSGEIQILGRDAENGALVLGEASRKVIPKTVWKRTKHDAGKWGSRTIREVLGNVSFDYAKSPYSVLDTLAVLVGDRPQALVLDFFGGSGTTYHATCLLNAQDGGRRQCILVTNNEVEEKLAKELHQKGVFTGQPEFEEHGICEAVTWPRCKFVTIGHRDDGTLLTGEYPPDREGNVREVRDGFAENIDYFRLSFLDRDAVAYGDEFEAIAPMLWLMAGARGELETARGYGKWFIPKTSPFGVLIQETAFTAFLRELGERPDVTHLFLVTDSEQSYCEMLAKLPHGLTTRMLYKSYLDNFRINTEANL